MASRKERRGCLPVILSWLGLGASFGTASEPMPYRRREDFLSAAERSFFGVLCQAAGETRAVFAKVRVADLLYVPQRREQLAWSNRIDRKHVDFVVCDRGTLQPLFALELDDASHARADRRQRDQFLDQAFEAAGLPLIRVPAQRTYAVRDLQALLSGAEQAAVDVPAARAVEGVPLCPKCGIALVRRTARQGSRQGEAFYGCPNYPRCRSTAPLTD